jgi:uncharacterized protein (DUF1684 family)
MKASRIYFFGIVLVIILILVYTFADTGVNDAYEREISQFRADKHEYFKSSADSPIKNKAQFSQLDYFPPDQHYRIMAAPATRHRHGPVASTHHRRQANAADAVRLRHFALEGREHRCCCLNLLTKKRPALSAFHRRNQRV